jgi:hypothetical protein
MTELSLLNGFTSYSNSECLTLYSPAFIPSIQTPKISAKEKNQDQLLVKCRSYDHPLLVSYGKVSFFVDPPSNEKEQPDKKLSQPDYPIGPPMTSI